MVEIPAAKSTAVPKRRPPLPRINSVVSLNALAVILAVASGSPGDAQPCNPAIDGTYCATLPKNALDTPKPLPAGKSAPVFESAFSLSRENQPATLGAISFHGDGTRCVGLLRRGSCK